MSDLYQKHTLCRFEQSSIRAADMAVFLSRCDADEVVRRGWRTRDGAAAVNPGVDPFFEATKPLGARQDIAFVGTFFHRKGSDVVVKVVSRLLAERPTLGFTVFGASIPAEAVLAQFEPSVRGRVTVVASVSAAELGERLAGFAIFLFPTRYEGFGIVLLEAMRAGLGVVTTPTGAGADLIRDGANGLLVPFGDPLATHAAVARLLDDRALLERVGAQAAEDARGRTWRRAAEELLAIYERTLDLARGGSRKRRQPR